MTIIRLHRSPTGLIAEGRTDFQVRQATATSRGLSAMANSAMRTASTVPVFYREAPARSSVRGQYFGALRADVPCRLDRVAVALSHGLGYCPGSLTIFEGISRLGPSAVLKVTAAETVIGGTLHPPSRSGLSRDDAIDTCGELFEESIRRLAGEARRVSIL
ncbi:MAG: hypothetical protein U1E87_08770 [Alphaproteobacteria bacterium]